MADSAVAKIVVDPKKSAQQYIQEAEKYFIIPALIRSEYPNLVKLIFETESMDNDEREYWLQILPIMSEEQIQKLNKILVNEKDQLAKLDAEYESELDRINTKHNSELNEVELKEKLKMVKNAEKASEEEEKKKEQDVLKQLGEL